MQTDNKVKTTFCTVAVLSTLLLCLWYHKYLLILKIHPNAGALRWK